MRSDLDHRDFDKTTGLPNQAKFTDELRIAASRRLRRGGALAVLAIDLDGFGLANEGLGPKAGDALLRQAGSRIARAARVGGCRRAALRRRVPGPALGARR